MAVYPSNMAPRETLGKRISDHSRHFIFRRPPKFFGDSKRSNWHHFFQESCVLEELGIFERHWQIPRRKSLPVVRLFFVYNPWRRGNSGTDCFAAADLAPKLTFILERFGCITIL